MSSRNSTIRSYSSELLIRVSEYISRIPCSTTSSTITSSLITFILFILLLEQISYLIKKRHLSGPPLVLPFLGTVLPLIRNPTKYWCDQAAYSSKHGLSANYIIGKFILFIRDSHLSHLIFSNVRPDAFMVIGHPFGKKLFGEHNLIYLFGEDHKGLRRRFAPNFTPKALSTYTLLQQRIIVNHLINWEKLSASTTPVSLRFLARDLNLETSQLVFVGPYMTPEARERFTNDYNLFNVGTMKLPIDLPGFAFHNARLAVDRLVAMLADCVRQSKMRMQRGDEPSCLTDFFVQETLREMSAAEEAGNPPPDHTTDIEMGSYLFDFLFAAQDASTSSLLWAVSLLESHPDVLAKVRAEVAAVWTPESNELISSDLVREMKYTQAVAREVVRYRTPATLVPHITVMDFKLTESYTIPKGTIVFPSVFESSFQGFTEADRFDPERFNEERQEDQVYKRNYLAFGSGPHQCVGQRYALNHLVLFMAMFSTLMDFKRHKTDGCDEIVYNPTISPKDGCSVFLSRRCAGFPSPSNE